LVVNEDLNNVEGYIGGNTFLEMGFAHVLNKKIFLLNPIPEMGYEDEIVAMKPVVLNNDLEKIKL
jgi:predicted RNA-binding protein with PUA domain